MIEKRLTTNAGAPVVDNQNIITAGRRGPALLQDVWFLEKLAHFDREVIPERRMRFSKPLPFHRRGEPCVRPGPAESSRRKRVNNKIGANTRFAPTVSFYWERINPAAGSPSPVEGSHGRARLNGTGPGTLPQ